MKNNRIREKLSVFAKILVFISLALIACGIYLDLTNETKLIDPIKDVTIINEEENTVSITTNDGSEVVPGNIIVNTKEPENNNNNNTVSEQPITPVTPSNQKPTNNNSNANSNTNTGKNNNNQTTPTTPAPVVEPKQPTIEELNHKLRVELQNAYGITILYGEETVGYVVGGLTTAPIDNPNTIHNILEQLRDALAVYPKGLFAEIKSGGIPLTVTLINYYSEKSVTGITDSSYSYANISIAAIYPFQESFYHESYHYIERYLFKRGANFNVWDSLNPEGFTYGTIIRDFAYANTFSATAPFVNNYAQTAATEDRASTFEYMMADTKASCLNKDTTVWKKAKYMASMLEAVLNTVNPNTTEYWERFL